MKYCAIDALHNRPRRVLHRPPLGLFIMSNTAIVTWWHTTIMLHVPPAEDVVLGVCCMLIFYASTNTTIVSVCTNVSTHVMGYEVTFLSLLLSEVLMNIYKQ